MQRFLLILGLLGSFAAARADIAILYLEPSDTAPVLGSISTDTEAYQEARPVEGKEGWMEVVREDYYSGFIARESLTPDGEVETGTAVLLTPSPRGDVLTEIEAGDEVTVNLVDEWTEITVFKEVPGYFRPEEEDGRRAAPPPQTGLTYAEDPLLERVGETRYSPPPELAAGGRETAPVAARGAAPTVDPMTGFEDVDNLNPAFRGDTGESGDRGFGLGPGSTPMPAPATTGGSAAYREGSMEAPASIARLPEPGPGDPSPRIEPPTQTETVDRLEETDAPEAPETDTETAGGQAPEETDSAEAEEAQEEAVEAVEESEPTGTDGEEEGGESAVGETDPDAEIIPLAPVEDDAEAAAETAGAAAAEAAVDPVEEKPTVIVDSGEDVEVTEEVAEAVVPGVTGADAIDEPPLVPPTDTNRTYIGRLERTSPGLFGGEPPFPFEIVNYEGDRIAYVDLSEVPMSSEEKFVGRIVRVYGRLLPSTEKEKETLLIEAANITLR